MDNTTAVQVLGQDPLIFYTGPVTITSTNTSLTANLLCRVTFALIANFVCLVPLRLLYSNGEFAAVVFIANVEVKNLFTVLYALIWRDDNVLDWWAGYGLCDVSPYIHNFITMLFITALLAITRNVACQVGLLRANPLTAKEKRRRNVVQALIMFPLPLLQVILTWFITAQRYAVGTLIGCAWAAYPTWVYLVFFILPPLLVALITAGYAILTYTRYRELAKTTATALSSNRQAKTRAQRTRRRLYLMVIAILIPFLPIVTALAVVNILDMGGHILPYSYAAVHEHELPYPWNTITFLRSGDFNFAVMNIAWIPILSAIPMFMFFGTTKDAMNDYRRLLLLVGLGRVFPGLHQEYDPDRTVEGSSFGSGGSAANSSLARKMGKFGNIATSFRALSHTSSTQGNENLPMQSMTRLTSADSEMERGHAQAVPTAGLNQQTKPPRDTIDRNPPNPWLLRTNLTLPHISIPNPFHSRSKSQPLQDQRRRQHENPSQVSLRSFRQAHNDTGAVRTRVWSEEETAREDGGDNRSVCSVQGVTVETHLIRETHMTDAKR